MDIYLHGIETVERNNGPRSVLTIDTGVIGMVFTAPDASELLWPLNTPVAVHGEAGFPGGLGREGTGPDAFNLIFKQATRASQTIVAVRIAEGVSPAATRANVLGNAAQYTGVHAFRRAATDLNLRPKLLIAPGLTSEVITDGVERINLTAGGTGYTEIPTVTITGGGGAGARAEAVIDSATGAVDQVIIVNAGSGYTSAPTIAFVGGGEDAEGAAATAVAGAVGNPVIAELLSIAGKMRAIVVADGPNTTTAIAVSQRMFWDTDRLWIIDPHVKVADGELIVSVPSSPGVAGLQARVDYEEGFWHTASNHVMEGVLGTGRPIDHSRSDPSAESQFMNKNAIATIVRSAVGGFKLWGSRAPSSDSKKVFISVRRTHDTIIDSIEAASEPFIDKPFAVQSILDIAETVNAALRRWSGMGATLGGRVWLDPGLNTAETWAAGRIFISYDAEGPAPMEHITFEFNRNTGYYTTLAQNAQTEIARMAATAVTA